MRLSWHRHHSLAGWYVNLSGWARLLLFSVLLALGSLPLTVQAEDSVSLDRFREYVERSVDTPSGANKKPIKIAIVYPGLQTSDYWLRSIKALQGRLDDHGLAYELDVRFSRPYIQQDLQESQLLEVLQNDPDYLVYTINSDRQRRVVEYLLQRERPKVIIQNLTQPVAQWFDVQPLMYIGFDHAAGARKLAQFYKRRYPKGTPFGLLYWDKGVVSEQRGDVFLKEVERTHQLKASYFTDASRISAKHAALKMLREYPDIRYIYACATDVSLGALDALRELGDPPITVNGWGGGEAELEMFRQQKLGVVLMRMNDQNGIAMAEAIRLDRLGYQIPLVFSGEFEVLTQSMEEGALEHLLERAFRYSGGMP